MFLKTKLVQVLLLAVGFNVNSESTFLAYAVVESESTEAWKWFNQRLRETLKLDNGTVIRDHEKCLSSENAVAALIAGFFHLICGVHHKVKLVKKWWEVKDKIKSFWWITNAKTKPYYDTTLGVLRALKNVNDSADYFSEIDTTTWVTAFYRSPNFSHKASNVVESMNRIFIFDRELTIKKLLDSIWK